MNKIPICLLTNNREDYLLQTLNSLLKCDNLDKFILYTSEEPPSKSLNRLFKSMTDHMEVIRNINKERKFINNNLYDILDYLFETYEYVFILEEDILVSQDALNFILWVNNNFKDNENCFGGCLNTRNQMLLKEKENSKYIKTKYFSSLGWSTWKHTWEKYYNKILPNIRSSTDNNPSEVKNNWDRKVMKFLRDPNNKYFVVKPLVSRTDHIGIYGENCKHGIKWHEDNISSKYWNGNKDCKFKSLINWEEENEKTKF